MDISDIMNLQEESVENQSSINQEPDHSHDDPVVDPETTNEDLPSRGGHSKKEGKDVYQLQLESFTNEFQGEPDGEKKLQLALAFMESTLAQGGTPHFRHFWEARRLCLPLFRENISPLVRSQLWNRYSDLSKEARRLKDVLDEQSAFAVEQIEIAIQAIEQDIEQQPESIIKGSQFDEELFPQVLKEQLEIYRNLQNQLSQLNVQASRINALRKELLKTEMRVRHKNKFFQRLSSAGDKVFPKRKELISQVSRQFIEDVESFIRSYFSPEARAETMLFELREDIKALQSFAKALTLNTNAFTQTRMQLSEAWDQLKTKEKERKKERAEQRVTFKHNAEAIHQKIQAFKEEFEKGEVSISDAFKRGEEIVASMRQVELGRDELRVLRDDLSNVRKLVNEKSKAEETIRQQREEEKTRQRKEKIKALKDLAENLVVHHQDYELDALTSQRDQLLEAIQEAQLTKGDKLEIERHLKNLKDIIIEKKEKAMMLLSDDDRQALGQLKEVLQQRKSRRQEIKQQLEVYRKSAGSSSLDFEKAMNYQTQINEEKERLEKINEAIKEVEDKIAKLQSSY